MNGKKADGEVNKTSFTQLFLLFCGFCLGAINGIVFTWIVVFPIYRTFWGGGEFMSGAMAGLMLLFAGAAIGGFIGLTVSIKFLK